MAVETLTIRSTEDYEDGRPWGDAGAYEVDAHYVQAGRFGAVRVWLRTDGLP